MKKIFTLLTVSIFALAVLYAQDEAPPKAFSYKATITKKNGAILANKTIGLQIKITPDSYVETFFPTTNLYGQIDIVIGENGGLEVIDWTSGEHFLEVYLDDKGGEDFEWISTTQLLSVPYALYAAEAGSTVDAVNLTEDQTIDGIKTFKNDILVNGLTIGRGENGIVSNTANGYQTLYSNTTGYANTAHGYNALYSNTEGIRNTGDGAHALELNTSGHRNTANGWAALYSNTTGVDNEATGYCALYSNTEGFANTANGDRALYSNTTGYANIANGGRALYTNTTGFHNIASGIWALYSNETGGRNIAIGYKAGYSNLENENIFLGSFAGFYETGSRTLYIDNLERENEEAARTQSLIYGVFDADPANQILTINGNVGIGTIDPTTKLDVAGDINFTGSLLKDGNPFSGDYNNLSNLPDLSVYATKAYVDKLEDMLITTGLYKVLDPDGNLYSVVKIGDQVWMAENLKTTKYKDGIGIPLVTNNEDWANLTTPGYCWQGNNQATYGDIYGALYNWYAVETGKLCPDGWHVPTDSDWAILTTYLGGEAEAGGKLKEEGTTHWESPNTGATNETGFTALPGSCRIHYDGSFADVGFYGYWWSSDEFNYDQAWCVRLSYESGNIARRIQMMKHGFSVRCIKD